MIVDKTPRLGARHMYLDVLHGFLVCASSVVEQKSELSPTMITHICKKNSWLFPLGGQHVWDQRQNHAFNAWITEVLGNNTYKRCLNMSESILMWMFISWKPSVLARSLHDTFYSRIPNNKFQQKATLHVENPSSLFLLNHNGCEIGTSGRD